MAELDLKNELKSLKQTLHEMKALSAWQKLKYAEARQETVSAIRFDDTTSIDLMDRYLSFLSVSTQMHSILNNSNTKISKAEQSRIKSKLLTMEYQVHYLGSGIRFY